MTFKTPILFLVFNRPDTARAVFEKIREQKPEKLYIASDGPRSGNESDLRKCKEVREIVNNIDWNCELKTLFRESNLGCKIAVSDGITWFFRHEEMGIILEDDCLPNNSFFPYCEELLNHYKDDDRVAGISGSNLLNYEPENSDSYFFSKYLHIWGWASWRRVWDLYDLKMNRWPESRKRHFLRKVSDGNPYFESYWSTLFNRSFEGKIDTWDYQFLFSYLVENKICCIPSKNLVQNIGFNETGTHTRQNNDMLSALNREEIKFPLIHPSVIKRELSFDIACDKKIFKMDMKHHLYSLYSKYKNKLRKKR